MPSRHSSLVNDRRHIPGMLCATGSCARANKVCVCCPMAWLAEGEFLEEVSCAHILVALGSGVAVKPHRWLSMFVGKWANKSHRQIFRNLLAFMLGNTTAVLSLSLSPLSFSLTANESRHCEAKGTNKTDHVHVHLKMVGKVT